MMQRRWLVALVLVVGMCLIACDANESQTATSPPATVALPAAPADVNATLAWMLERTMTCTESTVAAGSRRWECTGSTPWPDGSSNALRVTIDRFDAGGTHLLAVLDATETAGKQLCPGLSCDAYTGFFAETIAHAPITGGQGPAIGTWIEDEPHVGRDRQFGTISVMYRPSLPLLAMTIDVAAP